MTVPKNYWNDQMHRRLVQLYNSRPMRSFTDIAFTLSEEFKVGLTRNACIGKAHRMGLPLRGTNLTRKIITRVPKQRKIPMIRIRPVDAPIAPAIAPRPPDVEGITIYQLSYDTCRWPLGAAYARPPFLYCGEPAAIGCPYCEAHFEKAHARKAVA